MVLKARSLAVTPEMCTVPAVPPKTASLSVPESGQTTPAEAAISHQLASEFAFQVPVPPCAPAVMVSEPSQ